MPPTRINPNQLQTAFLPCYFSINTAYLTRRGTGVTTAALVANRRFYTPIYVPTQRTFQEIACVVTTAQAASIRMGIRNVDQFTGQPLDLIVDAGTVDASTAGLKSIINLNRPLSPDWYILEITSNGTPSIGAYSAPDGFFGTEFSAGGINPIPTLFKDKAFGGLDADESAVVMARSSTGIVLGIR